MATISAYSNTNREGSVSSPNINKPTRLNPQQLEEKGTKGLCVTYDNKYNKRHKCNEKKLIYIDSEDEDDPEIEKSQELDLEDTSPAIYFHALVNI